MKEDLSTDRNTIFGKEYSVVIYIEPSQHKGHISMLVNPEDKEKIKLLLAGIKRYDTWDKVY